MKTLLIPFFFLAAAMTANAHCGACGTGESHDKAPAAEKSCEDKAACCAKKKECSDKKECDGEKKECSKDKSCEDKKKCCGDDKCCADKEKKDCAEACDKPCDKSEKAAAKPEMPMPAMSCCAKEA